MSEAGKVYIANSITTKLVSVSGKLVDVAKTVGHRITRGTDIAVEFVLAKVGIIVLADEERGICKISPQMQVITSCGRGIGYVDEVVGNYVVLAYKKDRRKQQFYIPLDWVGCVDTHVFLNKNFNAVTEKI